MAAVRAVVTVVQADIAIDISITAPTASSIPAIRKLIIMKITNNACANLGFAATQSEILATTLVIHFTKGKNAFSNSRYNEYFRIANWSEAFCV